MDTSLNLSQSSTSSSQLSEASSASSSNIPSLFSLASKKVLAIYTAPGDLDLLKSLPIDLRERMAKGLLEALKEAIYNNSDPKAWPKTIYIFKQTNPLFRSLIPQNNYSFVTLAQKLHQEGTCWGGENEPKNLLEITLNALNEDDGFFASGLVTLIIDLGLKASLKAALDQERINEFLTSAIITIKAREYYEAILRLNCLMLLDEQATVWNRIQEANIAINAEDNEGKTLLHEAAKKGHLEAVKALLAVAGIKVNAKDNEGKRPLHYAAEEGCSEVVKALLAVTGIKVNAKDNYGYTPLHEAALEGHLEIVKELLSAEGIEINAQDDTGETPLHTAAMCESTSVVKALLAAGADMNAKGKYGDTPLHEAAREGHLEVVKDLLSISGIEANIKNNNGHTPLHRAVEYCHFEVIEILLAAAGIDVNAKDHNDWTPLHWAARKDHLEAVRALLAFGADAHATTNDGKTALDLDSKGNRYQIAALVRSAMKQATRTRKREEDDINHRPFKKTR